MTTEEFIDGLNILTAEVKSHHNEKWKIEMYEPVRKNLCFIEESPTLEEMFNNYHLNMIQLGSFYFRDEVEKVDSYSLFLGSDSDVIGIHDKTGEVVYINSSTGDVEYLLAPDIAVFLGILLDIGKYSMRGVLDDHQYTEDDRIEMLENCLNQLPDEKYHKYYQSSYGVPED